MSAPVVGISIREFAKRDGCSDKLVRRGIEKGRLTALPDGKLDPALVGTGWRQSARRGADSGADTADTLGADSADSPQGVRTPAEVAPTVAIIANALGIEPDDFMRDVLAGKFAEIGKAETVKENGLALKHLLDARQRAGSLVETEVAEAVLFEASRAARDAWMNWPVRIGPMLAADLGLDAQKVTEALTPYVQQQLEDLGEPEADFTPNRD